MTVTKDKDMRKQKQTRPHYRSIDVLRTCSLIEMVVVHFMDYLSTPTQLYYDYYSENFGAPMFLFLSGLCNHIGIESQFRQLNKNDGDRMSNVRWKFVKRGACLCIVGAAIVATSQYFILALECDAIVTSGLMQIVLALFLWEKSSNFLIFAFLSVILLTPVIRDVATTDVYWNYEDYELRQPEQNYTLLDVIKLHLVVGYFPLFPYASFSILGLLVGRVLVPRNSSSSSNEYKDKEINLVLASRVRNMSMFGAVLYGIGRWLARIDSDHAYLGGWTTPYQLTFPSCIGKAGRVLMWFGLVSYVVDFCSHEKGTYPSSSRTTSLLLDHIVGRLNKAPLTIYFLHSAVVFWPMRFAGWLYDKDDWWEEYAANVMVTWQAVIVGLFFIFGMNFVLGWIDQWRLPRIEHAMQWLCK